MALVAVRGFRRNRGTGKSLSFVRGRSAMPFSEFEMKKVEKALGLFVEKNRPPPHIRSKVDLGVRVQGHSVEIFEIRPVWDDPSKKIECAVAKATFVRTQSVWRVFWRRADLKWHSYDPVSEVRTIEQFLAVVEKDEYACFYG